MFQLPFHRRGKVALHYISCRTCLLRAPCLIDLNTSRDEVFAASLGNVFQRLATLSVKKTSPHI